MSLDDGDRGPISRLIDRAVGFGRARVHLQGARLGVRVWAGGPVRLLGDGVVILGDHVNLMAGIVPTEIRCARGGMLEIGADTVLNYGVFLEAHRCVRIGRRCMIASMVRIADIDDDGAGVIDIGDDVWIAHGATIRPGVTIGEGSVVSAGSVVTSNVPPRVLAIGAPARCMSLQLASARAR